MNLIPVVKEPICLFRDYTQSRTVQFDETFWIVTIHGGVGSRTRCSHVRCLSGEGVSGGGGCRSAPVGTHRLPAYNVGAVEGYVERRLQ